MPRCQPLWLAGHLDLMVLWIPVPPVLNSTVIYVGLKSIKVYWQEHWTGCEQSLVSALPLSCSVSLRKSLSLSGPQFHCLSVGNSSERSPRALLTL